MATNKIRKHDVDLSASDVGALPIINAKGSANDMDAIFRSSSHNAIYIWDANTLGTPYKYGKVSAQNGVIISTTLGSTYGYQIAIFHNSLPPMMRSNKGGTMSEWDTGFLPLSGGTLSGSFINLKGGATGIYSDTNYTEISTVNDPSTTDNRRLIQIRNSKNETIPNALRFTDVIGGKYNHYNIFGGHNKPSGSYTGNGSGSGRSIDVGGVGHFLGLRSDKGFGIASDVGMIFLDYANDKLDWFKSVTFLNGKLIIVTNSIAVNESGYTYYYELL